MPKVFIQSKGIWVNFPDSWDEAKIASGARSVSSGDVGIPESAPVKPVAPRAPEPGILERAGKAITSAAGSALDNLQSYELAPGEESLYDVPDAARKIEAVTGFNPVRAIESDLGTVKAMGADALRGARQASATANMAVHAAFRQPLEWLLGGFEKSTRPQMDEEMNVGKESLAHKAFNFPLKTLAKGEKAAAAQLDIPDPAKQFIANTAGMLGSMVPIGKAIQMGRAGMQALPKIATKLGASDAVAGQLAARPFFESMGAGLGAAVVTHKLDVTDPDFPTTAAMFMAFEAAPHVGAAAKRAGRPAWEKSTKKVLEESGSPRSVYVNAEKIWDLHGRNEKITLEEAQMVKDLGLTGPEYRKAAKSGLTIRLPYEKILSYGDRPWVQVVKKAFGQDPFIETRKVQVPKSYEFGPEAQAETVIKKPKARAEQPAEPQAPLAIEGPKAAATSQPKERLSSSDVVSYIDNNSKGALNLRALKEKVHGEGPAYELANLDPRALDIGDERVTVAPEQKIASGPVVVDSNGIVIDGRHRVLRAIMNGQGFIQAYKPAEKPAIKKAPGSIEGPKAAEAPKKQESRPPVVMEDPIPKVVEEMGKPRVPEAVQRIDEPGATGWVDKPQGLYTSPAGIESPHSDLGGKVSIHQTNPNANVLILNKAPAKDVVMRKGAINSGAGIHALYHIIGRDKFLEMKGMTRNELMDALSEQYPEVEWGKYYDKQEMLEGLGGIKAREAGHDAFYLEDPDPAWSEYVALTENAFSPVATETPKAEPSTAGSTIAPAMPVNAPGAMNEQSPAALEIDKKRPAEPSGVHGSTGTAFSESNDEIGFRYAVYNINDLKTSHSDDFTENPDYPQALQPRDRTRAAYIDQVNTILAKLNPALLGENPKVSDGAPIIGPDQVVESGNGRTIALRKGYASGHKNMKKYRAWLKQNAAKFGIDPTEFAGIKRPILVRERTSSVDREAFAKEANDRSQAEMSATEDAIADAKVLINKGIIGSIEVTSDGKILTARNVPIIRRFFQETTSKAGMGRYVDKDGKINQAGLVKIRNAIFAAAYGDTDALGVLAESVDDDAKNLTTGMLIAAPKMARAKTKMNAGALIEADISTGIAKAAQELRDIRESGETVPHRLAQMEMFDPMDPLTAELLRIFNDCKRSGKRLGTILSGYADIWEEIGDPRQAQIFGDGNTYEIGDILQKAERLVKNAEANKTADFSLFDGPTGGDEGPGSPPEKKAPADKEVEQAALDRQAQEAHAVTLSFMGTGELWDLGKKTLNLVAHLKPIRNILHNLGIKDQHDGLTITSKDYTDIYKYLQMPHDVKIQHPEFGPLYDRQVTRELSKAILDHSFAKLTEPYFSASNADRKKVDKALIGGEQQGIKELDPLTLKEVYGLDDNQIKMYLAIRDALDGAGELLISEMEDTGVSKEAIEEFKHRLAGYIPHKWYGNWAVVVRKPGGKKTVFMSKTGFTDRFKERDRLQQLYPNHDVFIMQSKKIPYEAYQDAAPWAVSKMVDMVIEKADTDPGTADELKQALSDLYKSKGFGQNFIKRKNVPGWTEDLARPLAEYFSGFNGYITKMKAIKGFAEDIKAIDPKKKPNLYRYALDYIRYVTGEQMEFGAAKQVAYVYYLYGNLKSAAVNLTQNLLLGWPVLSKHSKLSGPIMLQAQARAANRKLLSEKEKAFVQELEDMGCLDPKLAVEMSAFTSNPLLRELGDKPGRVAEAFDIFQHAESWNRRAMAVACYDAGIRDPWKAADLIEEAHFRYAKGNRPHLMRGPISPLMTFRSWAINYITWAKNEAKAGRFGALSRSALAMLLIGGLSAIPGYNLIKKAYIKAFGEDPWTSASRKMGDTASELAFRGLPSVFGISLTGSVGMGDILPMEIADAGGVFADVPVRIGKVTKDLSSRDYTRAIEDASPEVIRQPMAAWRSYSHGDTTRSGAPIFDPTTGQQKRLTAGEAAVKALGFQPSRSAEAWDLQSTMDQIKDARDAKKQGWANRYVVAMSRGDKNGGADVLREITAYNKQMKESGRPEDQVTKEEMMAAVMARKKAGVPPKYMLPKWKRLLEGRGMLPSQ